MSKTEEFEITWKGKKEKVIIKRMGYAEKCDFRDNFVETQLVGNMPKVTIHPFRMRIAALQKCVVQSPFGTSDKALNDIDSEEEEEIIDNVYQKIADFNHLDSEARKNSDGDSSMEQPVAK